MGYQSMRAVVLVKHNNISRIPGQTTGPNAQDFVCSDEQAAKLIGIGAAVSLGVANEPSVSVPMQMDVGESSRAGVGFSGASAEAARAAMGRVYVPRDATDLEEMFNSVSGAADVRPINIKLDASRDYVITGKQLTANIRNVALDMAGAIVYCDHNQPVIKMTCRGPSSAMRHSIASKSWENLHFKGLGKAVAGTCPIIVDGDQAPLGVRPHIGKLTVEDFETAISFRDRAYLATIEHLQIHRVRRGIWQQAATDAGENCSIGAMTCDQVDLAFHFEDGSTEWFVGRVSFDYMLQLLVATGSPVRLFMSKVHMEPRGAELALDPLNYVINGTGTDPRAFVPGRDSWIDLDSVGGLVDIGQLWFDANDSGGQAPYEWDHLIQVRNKFSKVMLHSWSPQNLQNTANRIWKGPGRVLSNWVHTQPTPKMPSRFTTEAHGNMLQDGEVANGALRDFWCITRDGAAITNRLVGANGSIARDGTLPDGAVNGSIKITKTSAAGTPFQVTVFAKVRPGGRVSAFLRARRSANSAPIYTDLRWFKSTGHDANGIPMFGTPSTASPFNRGDARSGTFSDATFAVTTAAYFDVELPMCKAGSAGEESAPEWCDYVGLTFNLDGIGAEQVNLTKFMLSPW